METKLEPVDQTLPLNKDGYYEKDGKKYVVMAGRSDGHLLLEVSLPPVSLEDIAAAKNS